MKILIDKNNRKLFIYPDRVKDVIHTHLGIIKKEQLLKAKNGSIIKTHLKHEFKVLEPGFTDLFENIKRIPQIIILKDAGTISAYTGIASGSKVVEAGSGSGGLTTYLANLVKPDGKIYSYEKRKDFAALAKENVDNFGLNKYVEIKNKDISKGISEKEVDVVVLDLPEPWRVIKHAEKALKPGGYFVSYVPTVNQLMNIYKALSKSKLTVIKTIETIEREWKIGDATRPLSQKIGHTAFITFARKI